MQRELSGSVPAIQREPGGVLEQSSILYSRPVAAHVVGVNEEGKEAGNEGFTAGRDLPWLQDSASEDVWDLWGVQYRDVLILDTENRVHAVYNLSQNDLNDPENYRALKELILSAAP